MLNRSLAILSLTAIIAGSADVADAAQHTATIRGREVVVHDSALPVLVHRALPPYWGKHVTKRQANAGRLPPGSGRRSSGR